MYVKLCIYFIYIYENVMQNLYQMRFNVKHVQITYKKNKSINESLGIP